MPKTLTTDRLILRGVTAADAPAYQKYFNDYEVIRQLGHHVPWPYPENGAADFIQNVILPEQDNDKWVWAIFLKTYPTEAIGAVDLWRKGSPENRGFWLGRPFWGQGLMTEAVTIVMDYAFDELGFETLIFSNAKGNIGSRRVKEKTGAKLIDVQPGKMVDPIYTEVEIWELHKYEWQAYRQNS